MEEIKRVGLRRWLLVELTRAFEEARKGKLRTHDEHSFDQNWMQNIVTLRDAILERRYEPGKSVAFVVFDPMVREIFAAPFRDRVVHHFLYHMQAGWWDRRFIYDSYSCRVGKGTLLGIKRAQKMMRMVTNGCTREAMIIKLDIQGYFMSLSRRKLYERVHWGLLRQFESVMDDGLGYQLYALCDYLWAKVLFDDPVEKAWRRGPKWHWDTAVLPPTKSLYTRPKGYGVVIGNLTSQLTSNIYMDQLDRFIKFTLGYKYYGRYVDDFFIMVPAERYEQAKKDVRLIEDFARDELRLTLHPRKRYYQSVYKGMSFLGARVYPHCLYPGDRIQAKFPEAVRAFVAGEGKWDSVVSYMGLLKHLDGENLVRKIFESVAWE